MAEFTCVKKPFILKTKKTGSVITKVIGERRNARAERALSVSMKKDLCGKVDAYIDSVVLEVKLNMT